MAKTLHKEVAELMRDPAYVGSQELRDHRQEVDLTELSPLLKAFARRFLEELDAREIPAYIARGKEPYTDGTDAFQYGLAFTLCTPGHWPDAELEGMRIEIVHTIGGEIARAMNIKVGPAGPGSDRWGLLNWRKYKAAADVEQDLHKDAHKALIWAIESKTTYNRYCVERTGPAKQLKGPLDALD